ILYKNGRDKGWHLRLLPNDREQVESILGVAAEFQKRLKNFQKELDKVSQTSSTMNADALQNFNMWTSCKENLLARRDQTFRMQQEKLDKFYQKVRKNDPVIVQQPLASTSIVTPKPSNNDQPQKQQESQSQSSLTTKVPKITSDDQRSSPSTLSKDHIKIEKYVEKCMPSVQSALSFQEKMNRNSLFILENKKFTKSLNDFAFLRNEISFIDNLISLVRSKQSDNKSQHRDCKLAPVSNTKSPINTVQQPKINPIQKSNTSLPNVPTQQKPNTGSVPSSTSSTSLSRQAPR
ncbi:hypothetical protein BLA29_009147, partial [Euroglyphus maynei]